jgi:glycosyltransferase involved in cell wall biosynthesis
MRVLLVASRYLPHRGGLETVVYHLAQELRSAGHEVVVVANRYPRTLRGYEVIDGVTVSRLHFLYPRARFARERRPDLLLAGCWYIWWTTWTLGQIIRSYRPDVVNLHYLGSAGLFLWLVRRWLCFPWVVSLHGGDVDGEPYLSRHDAWRFQAVTGSAEVVTACSRALASQAIELSPALSSKLQVIHNGVACQSFASATPYGHPRPYLVAVGQLVPHKGFDLLIDAFGDVASIFPNVDLLIAGEGEQRARLAESVRARGLADRAHLLGRVDEATVASLMAGSLFVAVPSRREPFGIVALEAMAAGKRVLATPVGGIPEFLPPEANRLVEPDRRTWAVALGEFLAAEAPDGAANQIYAQGFAWDRVAARYIEVYSRARASTGRP